jgi:prepilin-type N-terminal cleavage/methylation domain-containing protein
MKILKILKNKKAYTLTELLISMVIFSILMIMFTYITFGAIKISNEISLRSAYRETITETLDLIKRDIRNAESVNNCEDQECSVVIDQLYTWRFCPDDLGNYSICRYRVDVDGNETLLKKTADNIYINNITFERLDIVNTVGVNSSEVENTTVIVTVEAIPLKNQEDLDLARRGELVFDVRQVVISTRNVAF